MKYIHIVLQLLTSPIFWIFTFLDWNSVPIKHKLTIHPPHPTPCPGSWHLPMYFLMLWTWLFWIPHIRGIKQYLHILVHCWLSENAWWCIPNIMISYRQNIFTVLKTHCALSIQPSPPPNPWKSLIFGGGSKVAFSRVSYIWTHTICSLFRLVYFI